MGKRSRESYDANLRKTVHGSKLYNAWKKLRVFPHCAEWESFPQFYNWAMSNGFQQRAWLRRNDDSKPYGPDNCFWRPAYSDENAPVIDREGWAYEWNKTVNRIRKHYGMPPLEGTSYDDI